MEKKSVKTNRRKYDADFKKEVLRMIESGRTVPDVAQSLGIGTNLIYYWLKRTKQQSPSTSLVSNLSLDSDKIAMQKRIKELEMERDILKKALGIFSR
ncbi:MAG: transposase [Saprospiraceae bacterium]